VVVNREAGFFRKQRMLRSLVRELGEHLDTLDTLGEAGTLKHAQVVTHYTAGPGDAARIAGRLAEEADAASGQPRLIVAAGGDGTAHEIATGLLNHYRAEVDAGTPIPFRLMRFPLGTGNDGPGPATFHQAYDALLRFKDPVVAPVVDIASSDGRRWYALNIASVGIDAYIADLSNRLKPLLPGDAYRFLANLGVLGYRAAVRKAPLALTLFAGSSRLRASVVPSMVVVGVSGNRSYGRGKQILPNDGNVCVVQDMNVLKRLATKHLFYRGDHGRLHEVRFFHADAVTLVSDVRLPLQVDGEVTWLPPSAFPLKMTVRKNVLPVIG
jgi:diacylglycerol kinase family enzyme